MNSRGQTASVTDNAGTTTYNYDFFGNLTQLTKSYEPNATVTMGYDIRGRKTSMNDPDMGAWSYGYDVLGQLLWQKDAKAKTISMTYDLLGRMQTRVVPSGGGTMTSTWTYDIATNGKGMPHSISNPIASEYYTYDSLSRPSSVTATIGGVAHTTSYTYDAYGRPLTLTYPVTGFALRHCYDAVGFLVRVENATNASACSSSLPAYWIANAFDANNRLTKETFGNGLVSERAYDPDTDDLQFIKTGATNPTSVQNSTYGFDAVDNLTARSWSDGNAVQSETFGYDNLNRLTSVTGPAPKTYSYDPNGNITFKTGVGNYYYSTNGVRPHAVTSTVLNGVTTSYDYDANGNMFVRAGKLISYTSFNKPTFISSASGVASLNYDANFNRVTKTAPGGTTTYVGKLYEKTVSGTITTQKHYIYAGNNLVGAYNTVSNGTNNTQYFHTDYLGSVEVITDQSGNVSQRLSYDAFGKRRNANGTDATSITAQTTRGYTRHEHDDEAGLINMNAREYDPLLGRFTAADTVVGATTRSQEFNRYSYVNNNPLSAVDPSGHFSLGRSLTRVLNRVSEIKYVGNLLSISLITGTQFGYAYGASTGDWQTVFRAHATGTVIAFSYGAGGSLYAADLSLPSFLAGSYGLGYTSGYSIARINGASASEARAAGRSGGSASVRMQLYFIGWDAMRDVVNADAVAGGNTSQCPFGPCTAGTKESTLGYDPVTGEPIPQPSLTGAANQGMGSETQAAAGHPELRGPHDYDVIPGADVGVEAVSKVHDFDLSWTYENGLYAPSIGHWYSGTVNDLRNVYSLATMLPAAAYTVEAFGGLYLDLNNDINMLGNGSINEK
jgi:RHS repeat-associated protein